MDIHVETLDESAKIVSVTFDGRLDSHSRKQAKAELHETIKGSASFVLIDLSQVPFIDSSGLSALVSGLRVARENNKEFLLVGLSRQAQMVFSLTMMDRVFTIYPSVEVALENISTK